MIDIRPGTLLDISYITANLREQDQAEIFAAAALTSTVEAAVLSYRGSPGWNWTAQIDGQPVSAFGVAQTGYLTPHIRTAWAFGRKQFKRTVPAITRFTLEHWPNSLASEGVTRLEVRSLLSHDIAHKWLSGLGAEREGLLRGYGVDGQDFELWAWTKKG